jgi:Domain of unknown function (DU1801)
MKELDNFYLQQTEPVKAIFFALKEIILKQDSNITNTLKYGMPFFCYKGKMFCYLWLHKKYKQPYIGIVEGKYFDEAFLIQESRSRMKIMLFDPNKDLPVKKIEAVVNKAISLYKTGKIKIAGGKG